MNRWLCRMPHGAMCKEALPVLQKAGKTGLFDSKI
jgi:hypothetical protein